MDNAIVWQDRRTRRICDALKRDGHDAMLARTRPGWSSIRTSPAPSSSGCSTTSPAARARAARGELVFGTIDTWLIWKLTGGKVHVTDFTNASRTMLFNIHARRLGRRRCWRLLDIPRQCCREVRASTGDLRPPRERRRRVPIAGIAGDQQAALFGQTCFEPGDAKNTYGTGCFLLLNTGDKAVTSTNGLLTTIAWRLGTATSIYALEGAVFIAGAVVQWLRDGLKIIPSARDIEALAASVAGHRRRLPRPGVRRARRAVLGRLCARRACSA